MAKNDSKHPTAWDQDEGVGYVFWGGVKLKKYEERSKDQTKCRDTDSRLENVEGEVNTGCVGWWGIPGCRTGVLSRREELEKVQKF